mmetsp:Transcript_34947/g.96591  ORF Transcript_34947/g.96591 Transcript_34947/m.96591 type:complete len:318 (+) Transcript_34947:1266-2219(+)
MPERNVLGVEGGGPVEDEHHRRALERGDHGADQQHARSGTQGAAHRLQRTREGAVGLLIARPVILVPGEAYDESRDEQQPDRKLEGRHVSAVMQIRGTGEHLQRKSIRRHLSDQASGDGSEVLDEECNTEHVLEQVLAEAVAMPMFGHHPAFERREEQRRGDTVAHAAEDQDVIHVAVLREAAGHVEGAVKQRAAPTPPSVRDRAHEGAARHGRPEAHDEEACNFSGGEAVGSVERVGVRALDPVCGDRQRPDYKVPHPESRETWRKVRSGSRPCKPGEGERKQKQRDKRSAVDVRRWPGQHGRTPVRRPGKRSSCP